MSSIDVGGALLGSESMNDDRERTSGEHLLAAELATGRCVAMVELRPGESCTVPLRSSIVDPDGLGTRR
jgi:hypothetical protein